MNRRSWIGRTPSGCPQRARRLCVGASAQGVKSYDQTEPKTFPCGCGLVIATDEHGHIINAEGDPDHITNRGALDPKSISVPQLSNSPLRLKNVMYRAPNSDRWEEKSWDWAMTEIAQRIKKTRDDTFVSTVKANGKSVTVNRTEGLAWLGGAANNSEDCYLSVKLARALGVVYLEHQARI
jgi:anaerobic selenocysteine-containing dehydrogenase